MSIIDLHTPHVDQGVDTSLQAADILKVRILPSMQTFMEMLSETNAFICEAIRHSQYNCEVTHEWLKLRKEMIDSGTQLISNVWKECRSMVEIAQKNSCQIVQELRQNEINFQLTKFKFGKQSHSTSSGMLEDSHAQGANDCFSGGFSSLCSDLQSLDLTCSHNLEGILPFSEGLVKMHLLTRRVILEAMVHSQFNLQQSREWRQIEKEIVDSDEKTISKVWQECISLLEGIQKNTAKTIQEICHSEMPHQMMKHKLGEQSGLFVQGHLDLSHLTGVTDAFLEQISSSYSEVQSIDLTGCTSLTGACRPILLTKFTKLTSLRMAGCGPWNGVTTLDFSALLNESSLCELIACCPKLTTIISNRNQNTTDKVLQAIIRHCQDLTHLNLYSCNKITDKGVNAVLSNCSNLGILILNNTNVQNITVRHNLKTLHLAQCPNITNQDLQKTLQNCPELTDLYVWMSEKITDEGLANLSTHCPDIRTLSLSGTKFTATFLKSLVLLPNLTYLGYSKHLIAPEELQKIRTESKHPALKTLRIEAV